MRGRTIDEQFWKILYSSSYNDWDPYYGDDSSYGNSNYESNFSSRKTKRKHKFLPVLLIFTTAYNCEHCKRKKEDCRFDHCEDEEKPPGYDLGDWG